jgi:hypothetical protein
MEPTTARNPVPPSPSAYVHTENQLETLFRMRVRNVLGGRVEKFRAARSGVPDRVVILPLNRLYVVELKTETGELEPLQVQWHATALRLAPRCVFTLYGLRDIDNWVRERAQEYDHLIDLVYGKD